MSCSRCCSAPICATTTRCLAIDLTNPDIFSDQRIVLQKDTLHIVRTVFLWRGTAYQRLGVRNFGDRAADLRLVIRFDSDFADLFEVRGLRRDRRGVVTRKLVGPDQVLLSYRGLDGKTRRTRLTFDPPPDQARRECRLLPAARRPRRRAAPLPCGRLRPGGRASDALHARLAGGAPRAARRHDAAAPRSRARTSCSTRSCAARPRTSPC